MHKYKYFISYKRDPDKELAVELSNLFGRTHTPCFVDEHHLVYGDDWKNDLLACIHDSEKMIALFTPEYIEKLISEESVEDNIILYEVNIALELNKLIPVVIGSSIEEMLQKCAQKLPKLRSIHTLSFASNDAGTAKQLYSDIFIQQVLREKRAETVASIQSTENSQLIDSAVGLSSEDAYYRFDYHWPTKEAIQYKASLEDKELRTEIENTVLAKFYLSGRFGIPIQPKEAMKHLNRAESGQCKYAFFEIAEIYFWGGSNYGFDDDKALKYYQKADELDFYPASLRIATLLKAQCNQAVISRIDNTLGNTEHDYSTPDLIDHQYQIYFDRAIQLAIQDQPQRSAHSHVWFATALLEQNKDVDDALASLNQAVEQGSIEAKRQLAACYLGYYGVERELNKAAKPLHDAEALGSCWARQQLAKLHLDVLNDQDDFLQHSEHGIDFLKENIQLNYHDSSEKLTWYAHENGDVKHSLSHEEIKTILKTAYDFGNFNSATELAYYNLYEWSEPEKAGSILSEISKIQSINASHYIGYVCRELAELYLDRKSEYFNLELAKHNAWQAFLNEDEYVFAQLFEISVIEGNFELANIWCAKGNISNNVLFALSDKWSDQGRRIAHYYSIKIDEESNRKIASVNTLLLESGKWFGPEPSSLPIEKNILATPYRPNKIISQAKEHLAVSLEKDDAWGVKLCTNIISITEFYETIFTAERIIKDQSILFDEKLRRLIIACHYQSVFVIDVVIYQADRISSHQKLFELCNSLFTNRKRILYRFQDMFLNIDYLNNMVYNPENIDELDNRENARLSILTGNKDYLENWVLESSENLIIKLSDLRFKDSFNESWHSKLLIRSVQAIEADKYPSDKLIIQKRIMAKIRLFTYWKADWLVGKPFNIWNDFEALRKDVQVLLSTIDKLFLQEDCMHITFILMYKGAHIYHNLKSNFNINHTYKSEKYFKQKTE